MIINKLILEELEKRKPLWIAFSELWLDTEVDQNMLTYIVNEMQESGYSITELKYIYQYEVAPVVYTNLLNVAGVWEGFDEQWLYAEIQKNINQQNMWSKLWFYVKKPIMFYATKHHWATLENLFIEGISND